MFAVRLFYLILAIFSALTLFAMDTWYAPAWPLSAYGVFEIFVMGVAFIAVGTGGFLATIKVVLPDWTMGMAATEPETFGRR